MPFFPFIFCFNLKLSHGFNKTSYLVFPDFKYFKISPVTWTSYVVYQKYSSSILLFSSPTGHFFIYLRCQLRDDISHLIYTLSDSFNIHPLIQAEGEFLNYCFLGYTKLVFLLRKFCQNFVFSHPKFVSFLFFHWKNILFCVFVAAKSNCLYMVTKYAFLSKREQNPNLPIKILL